MATEATPASEPAMAAKSELSAAVVLLVPPGDVVRGEEVLVHGALSPVLEGPAETDASCSCESTYVLLIVDNPMDREVWTRSDRLVAVQRYVTGPAAIARTLSDGDWANIAAALAEAADDRENRAGQSCPACAERPSGVCSECADSLVTAGDYRVLAGRLAK